MKRFGLFIYVLLRKGYQRSVIVIDMYFTGFRKLIMKEDGDTKTE